MGDWLDSIQARANAQAKYDKNNTVGLYMKLNIHTDMDIIRRLWCQRSKNSSGKSLPGKILKILFPEPPIKVMSTTGQRSTVALF